MDACQYFVKPELEKKKLNLVSIECQNLTHFNESLVENACGLQEAIYEVIKNAQIFNRNKSIVDYLFYFQV